MGAATPDFMRKIFRDEIGDEGFKSRCIFIFEHKDRKTAAFIPELNEHQKECELYLLNHIKNLTNLYGQVEVQPEAIEFIEDWWKRSQVLRPNINDKLKHYYARKKVHVLKLACAIHFAESLEMTLNRAECEQAVKMLDMVEPRMHHALIVDSKNPYYQLGMKILKYLTEAGGKSLNELRAYFWEQLPTNDPNKALDDTLNHYVSIGKIITTTDKQNRVTFSVMKEGSSLD